MLEDKQDRSVTHYRASKWVWENLKELIERRFEEETNTQRRPIVRVWKKKTIIEQKTHHLSFYIVKKDKWAKHEESVCNVSHLALPNLQQGLQ